VLLSVNIAQFIFPSNRCYGNTWDRSRPSQPNNLLKACHFPKFQCQVQLFVNIVQLSSLATIAMVIPGTDHNHRNLIISQKRVIFPNFNVKFNYLWKFSIFNLLSNRCHGNVWHTSQPLQTDFIKFCYLRKFQSDTLIGSRDIAVYSSVQCTTGLG